MKVIVLGSGSSGNATLLIANKKKWLIDIGFNYKKMNTLLEKYHVKAEEISGIFISHMHKDHVNGLKSFLNHNHTKVYVNKILYNEIIKEVPDELLYQMEDDEDLDDIHVTLIHTSHDAVGSVGFVILNKLDNNTMVYITDTGFINKKNFPLLKNRTFYIIESNHDINMLMDGPYPYFLKQRVLSDVGHLSNEMASNYLNDFIGKSTKKIVLAHLSKTNNTKEIALDTIKNIMNNKLSNIEILVASQDESIEVGEL